MIQFNFDFHDGLNQIILILLVMLLPVQLWLLLFKSKPSWNGRLYLRLGLNILLWLVTLAFVLQPFWFSDGSGRTALLFGEEVSDDFRQAVRDSLPQSRVIRLDENTDAEKLLSVDSLVVAGQSFSDKTFNNLLLTTKRPALKWIPFRQSNSVYNLHWKAVLRKGEMQTVSGNIRTDAQQQLRLSFAGRTIDSTKLSTGDNSFRLQAPAFAQGQSWFTLTMGEKVLDTLHFFARPSEPLVFQFVQQSPDFESRNLATWLGKNGHSVQYLTTLSKDLESKESINMSKKEADIIVTDPMNASGALVKKALAAGKSVLFINIANPLSDIGRINTALGTKFALKRTSQQESVTIASGLTAFPYLFSVSGRQLNAADLPVAIEKQKGKVAVSLLNETFPLMLAGDSLAYQKVWNSILALVHPSSRNNISVEAPVISGLPAEVSLNNFANLPTQFTVGSDTIFPVESALNGLSYSASFRPVETGWLSTADSSGARLFVEKQSNYSDARIRDFLNSYFQKDAAVASTDQARHQPSPWLWLGLLLGCLTAVWVETKL
ncbi:hypothetical protein DSL64_07660 [Dyadobacter luteus]|uniref:Aerotolerance regulator N-terminal domain-containing protein n=1 Tax=Dyadobacter luteus TaxID=2259619 RepID=A0A3D8YHI5_9BACT|nr:hypothetical protein [Dyadobacter luteus]REA62789.1 hypothetical protein DSL64_07660 [Dyadobacter luteus]